MEYFDTLMLSLLGVLVIVVAIGYWAHKSYLRKNGLKKMPTGNFKSAGTFALAVFGILLVCGILF